MRRAPRRAARPTITTASEDRKRQRRRRDREAPPPARDRGRLGLAREDSRRSVAGLVGVEPLRRAPPRRTAPRLSRRASRSSPSAPASAVSRSAGAPSTLVTARSSASAASSDRRLVGQADQLRAADVGGARRRRAPQDKSEGRDERGARSYHPEGVEGGGGGGGGELPGRGRLAGTMVAASVTSGDGGSPPAALRPSRVIRAAASRSSHVEGLLADAQVVVDDGDDRRLKGARDDQRQRLRGIARCRSEA